MSLVSSNRSSSGVERQMLRGPGQSSDLGIPLYSRFSRSLSKPKSLQSACLDEKQGVWKCRNCGWTYPYTRPNAHQRREHKKICPQTQQFQNWVGQLPYYQGVKGWPEEGYLSRDGSVVSEKSLSPERYTISSPSLATPGKDAGAELLDSAMEGHYEMAPTGDGTSSAKGNYDLQAPEVLASELEPDDRLTGEEIQNANESQDLVGGVQAQDNGEGMVSRQEGIKEITTSFVEEENKDIDEGIVLFLSEETKRDDVKRTQNLDETKETFSTTLPSNVQSRYDKSDSFDFTWIERSDVGEADDGIYNRHGDEVPNDSQVATDNQNISDHAMSGILIAEDRAQKLDSMISTGDEKSMPDEHNAQQDGSISVDGGEKMEWILTEEGKPKQEPVDLEGFQLSKENDDIVDGELAEDRSSFAGANVAGQKDVLTVEEVVDREDFEGPLESHPSSSWQGALIFGDSNWEDWENLGRGEVLKSGQAMACVNYFEQLKSLDVTGPVVGKMSTALELEDVVESEAQDLTHFTNKEETGLAEVLSPSSAWKLQDVVGSPGQDLSVPSSGVSNAALKPEVVFEHGSPHLEVLSGECKREWSEHSNPFSALEPEDVARVKASGLEPTSNEVGREDSASRLEDAVESGPPDLGLVSSEVELTLKTEDSVETEASRKKVKMEWSEPVSPTSALNSEDIVQGDSFNLGTVTSELELDWSEVSSPSLNLKPEEDVLGTVSEVERDWSGASSPCSALKLEDVVEIDALDLEFTSSEVEREQLDSSIPGSVERPAVQDSEEKEFEAVSHGKESEMVSSVSNETRTSEQNVCKAKQNLVKLTSAEKNWEDWDDVIKSGYGYIKSSPLSIGNVIEDVELASESHLLESGEGSASSHEIVNKGTCSNMTITSEPKGDQTSILGLKASLATKNWEDWEDVITGDACPLLEENPSSLEKPNDEMSLSIEDEQSSRGQWQGAVNAGANFAVGDRVVLGELVHSTSSNTEENWQEGSSLGAAALKNEPRQTSRRTQKFSSAERNWEDWEHVIQLKEPGHLGGQEKDSISEWEGVRGIEYDVRVKSTPVRINDIVQDSSLEGKSVFATCLFCTDKHLKTGKDQVQQTNIDDPNQEMNIEATMASGWNENDDDIAPGTNLEHKAFQSGSSKKLDLINTGLYSDEGNVKGSTAIFHLESSGENFSEASQTWADWEDLRKSDYTLLEGSGSPGPGKTDSDLPSRSLGRKSPHVAITDDNELPMKQQPLKRVPTQLPPFQVLGINGSLPKKLSKGSKQLPSSGFLSLKDLELQTPLSKSFQRSQVGLSSSKWKLKSGDGFSKSFGYLGHSPDGLHEGNGREITRSGHDEHSLTVKDRIEHIWCDQNMFDLYCPVCGSLITNKIVLRNLDKGIVGDGDSRLRNTSEILPGIPLRQIEDELTTDTSSDEELEPWNRSLGACFRYFLAD